MVKVCPFLVPKGFRAITIWPFVLVNVVSDKEDAVLLQHERIHLRQQLEGLLVFFYVWYCLEFMIRWVRTQSKYQAYRHLSMEREAYSNERDKDYLTHRKPFAFFRYL